MGCYSRLHVLTSCLGVPCRGRAVYSRVYESTSLFVSLDSSLTSGRQRPRLFSCR